MDPVLNALNDSLEDTACLAALQSLEPSSDPTIAALNDSDEDAACLGLCKPWKILSKRP